MSEEEEDLEEEEQLSPEDEKLLSKTLGLACQVLRCVFRRPEATECLVTMGPSGDNRNGFTIRIRTDAAAFGAFHAASPALQELIHQTCSLLVVTCRERGACYKDGRRTEIDGYERRDESGIEAEIIAPGFFTVYSAFVDLCEALMPPPNLTLKLHERVLRPRGRPSRKLKLAVGERTVVGEVHGIPPRSRGDRHVRPFVLCQGIPVGPCSARCQFNVTDGLDPSTVKEWLAPLNEALKDRLGRRSGRRNPKKAMRRGDRRRKPFALPTPARTNGGEHG